MNNPYNTYISSPKSPKSPKSPNKVIYSQEEIKNAAVVLAHLLAKKEKIAKKEDFAKQHKEDKGAPV